MTFYCKNFDCNRNCCMKLNADCIPGRPGCVLEGKVKFSEEIEERLKDLAEKRPVRKRIRRGQKEEDPGPGRRRRRRVG
jgi:hypothetical protein